MFADDPEVCIDLLAVTNVSLYDLHIPLVIKGKRKCLFIYFLNFMHNNHFLITPSMLFEGVSTWTLHSSMKWSMVH